MSTPDLGYISVKTEINYGFNCFSQNYTAELVISIPANEDGRLIELARNNNCKLMDNTLHNNWGQQVEDYRVASYTIFDSDFNTLQSVACETLKDQIETLETVILTNRKAISKLPANPIRQGRLL